MFRKQAGAFLLAAVLTCSVTTPTLADTQDEILWARSEKNEAEALLTDTENRISEMEGQKAELERYLEGVNEQLTELSTSLTGLKQEIGDKTAELERTGAAVNRAQLSEERQYESMVSRIQYMYENGPSTLFVGLLESEDISSLLNAASEAEELASFDRAQLLELQETRKAVEERKAELLEEEAELESLKEESEKQHAKLKAIAEETDEQIAEYASSISLEELAASSLTEKIQNQKTLIERLEEQAAEEEAARLEEERKAREAEELARQKEAEEEAREKAEAAAAPEDEEDDILEDAEEKGDADYSDERYDEDEEEEISSEEDERLEEEESVQDEADISDESEEDSEAETEEQSDSGTSSDGETYLGNFKLTAYCNCEICCGRAGANTASGVKPSSGHTVAMGGVPFGTKLRINGTVYTVEDRGTSYGHVDIFMDSHQEALNFGLGYADVYQVN